MESLLKRAATRLTLGLVLAAPLAWAADTNVDRARGFLGDLIHLSELSRAKQGQQDDGSRKLVQSLSQRIDFELLAQRSLGKPRWSALKAQERKDFLGLLQELLEDVVYPQARKISSKAEALSFRSEGARKDQVLIEGTVERENKGEIVSTDLKVALVYDPKSHKILDAVLENEQISSNLKRQFDAALKKQTFAQILVKMKKRVQEAKGSTTAP